MYIFNRENIVFLLDKKMLSSLRLLVFMAFVVLFETGLYGQTITGCSGTFFDTGGAGGNYAADENYNVTYCPDNPAIESIEITFTSFDVEGSSICWDELEVFDGNSTAATSIGQYCNGTGSPGTVSSTDASGCLTFQFTSDSFTHFGGWEATVTCVPNGGGGGPTCFDSIQNGDETGVDCGGSTCPPCGGGGGGISTCGDPLEANITTAGNYAINMCDDTGPWSGFYDVVVEINVTTADAYTFCSCNGAPANMNLYMLLTTDCNTLTEYESDGSNYSPEVIGFDECGCGNGTGSGCGGGDGADAVITQFLEPGTTYYLGISAWEMTPGDPCESFTLEVTGSNLDTCTDAAPLPDTGNTTGSDCSDAVTICDSGGISYNPVGPGNDDFASAANDAGCLGTGENLSAWYYFEFDASMPANSTISFTIDPSGTDDYDFAIWGPDVTCGALGSPIACSFDAGVADTGLSTSSSDNSESASTDNLGGSSDGFVTSLTVNPGEGYYLLVDNYSTSYAGFDLNWSGSAMTYLDCTAEPECNAEAGTLSITGNVTNTGNEYTVALGGSVTFNNGGGEVLPPNASGSSATVGYAIFNCDPTITAGCNINDPTMYTSPTASASSCPCYLGVDPSFGDTDTNTGGSSGFLGTTEYWVVKVTLDYFTGCPAGTCDDQVDANGDGCFDASELYHIIMDNSTAACNVTLQSPAAQSPCQNDVLTLNATDFYTGTPSGTLSYSWSSSPNNIITGSTTGSSVSINTSALGTNTVTLQLTEGSDVCGTGPISITVQNCGGPCTANAGTYTVEIDGVAQAACDEYDLPNGSYIEFINNGDIVLPPAASGIYPPGIAFAIFSSDPSALDLTNPASYSGANGYIDADTDNTDDGINDNADDGNCGGFSISDNLGTFSTLWVVPVTYDYNECVTGGIGCTFDFDNNGDNCIAAGCVMQINYLTTPNTTLACGGVFTDPGGAANEYCPDSNIEYTICPDNPATEVVEVTFSNFELETIAACADEMEIFNGNSTGASSMGVFCGTNSPGVVTSTDASGCLTFLFTSDGSVQEAGWEATIDCISPPAVCGSTFTDPGGAGGNYPANQNITYNFCPDTPGDIVTVTFSSFDMNESFDSGCPNDKDYLEVYDGNGTTTLISRHCGDNPLSNGDSFTSTSADGCLTFVFFSNSNGQVFPGWEAIISCGDSCPTTIDFINN